MSDITDVRKETIGGNPAFAFETEDDVYQIRFHRISSGGVIGGMKLGADISGGFEDEWIGSVVQRIRDKSDGRE